MNQEQDAPDVAGVVELAREKVGWRFVIGDSAYEVWEGNRRVSADFISSDDADFIAEAPAAILALVERAEDAERERDALLEVLDGLGATAVQILGILTEADLTPFYVMMEPDNYVLARQMTEAIVEATEPPQPPRGEGGVDE